VFPSGFPAAAPPGSGSLAYVPWAFQFVGRPDDDLKSEFLLRGGYVNASQTTPGTPGLVSTQTDTSITQKFTYLGIAGVQPFVSVSLNLPTGKPALFGNSANARMDPDLVEIASFGEGFNVGPTIGVNVPITPTLLTSFGLGYTKRGAYEREGAVDPTTGIQGLSHFQPGDNTTANSTLAYKLGNFILQASASISAETESSIDGAPITKPGNRYLTSLSLSYAWTDYLSTSLTGNYTHSLRNKVIDPTSGPGLIVESFNSNSNLFKAVLDVTGKVNAWSFGPTGSFLYRDHNAWSTSAMEFLPGKTRYSAGGTAGYAVNNALSFNARVERIWIHENENPDKFITVPDDACLKDCLGLLSASGPLSTIVPGSGVPSVNSTGWLFSLAATTHF
jgi:hypothetical protein